MFLIIEKRGYYKQMQVSDYFGKICVRVIDLRYKDGRISFNRTFGREKSIEIDDKRKTRNAAHQK